MLHDGSQIAGECLYGRNASESIFQAGVNAARRCNGGVPVRAMVHRCWSAIVALQAPSDFHGPSRHRRPRIN